MWYCNSRSRSPSSFRSRNQLRIRFIARYPRQKSVGPLPSDEPSYLSQHGAAFGRSVSMNRTWLRVQFPIASNRLSASLSVPAGGALDTEIPDSPGQRISRSVRAAGQSRTRAPALKRGFGESACRACLEEWEIVKMASIPQPSTVQDTTQLISTSVRSRVPGVDHFSRALLGRSCQSPKFDATG